MEVAHKGELEKRLEAVQKGSRAQQSEIRSLRAENGELRRARAEVGELRNQAAEAEKKISNRLSEVRHKTKMLE